MANLRARNKAKAATALTALLLVTPVFATFGAQAAPGDGWSVPWWVPAPDGADSSQVFQSVISAADRSGNVLVVFDLYNGSGYSMVASRFVPGQGWGSPTQISAPGSVPRLPALSFDPYGNALAAWWEWNGSAWTYAFAFYAASGGWLPAVSHMSNFSYFPSQPEVAMDGLGNGYLVAHPWNGSGYELWAARVNINGTYGPWELLDFPNGTYGSYYDFAASPTGGAMLVSSTFDGNYYNMSAVRYQLGTGWLPAEVIEDSTTGAFGCAVGFDDSGRALVWWRQAFGGFYTYSRTWSPAEDWSGIEGAQSYASVVTGQMDLDVTPSGLAVGAFLSYVSPYYVPGAATYVPGKGWQDAHLLTGYGYFTTPVAVDADASGNAVVLIRNGSTGAALGGQFTSGGWGPVTPVLDPSVTSSAIRMSVANMGSGRALASVLYYDGSAYRAPVNVFSALDTSAPLVTLDTPFNGASFGGGSASVGGWAEPGAQVTVNGFPVVSFPDGRFEANVPVGEGVNVLRARAVDAAGNVGFSNTRTVTQTSPSPLLEAERRQAGASGWLEVQHMENLSLGTAWWPRVQSDASGNAWAAWYEYSAGRYSVYANRYTRGVGWGTPMLLRSSNDGNIVDNPRFAVNSQGDALFLYNHYNASNANLTLWGRLWLASGGWQDPVRLDNATRWAYQMHAAAAPDGQLGATWRQNSPGLATATVHALVWNRSTGWGAPEQLSPDTNVTHVPNIAFTSGGTALVTAALRTGSVDDMVLYARAPGGAWSSGSVLTSETSFIRTPYVLRSVSETELVVSWVQVNGSVFDWRAGRISNGSLGQQVVFRDSWDWWPEVAIDDDGYAFIGLTESSTGVANAVAAVAPPGQMFGTPVALDNATGHGGGTNLMVHRDGTNVSVFWDEVEGVSRSNMRGYSKATDTWGPVQRISPDHLRTHIPHAAPMPDGGMLVVWARVDYDLGFYQIESRRFVPPETVPPALVVDTPSPGFLTQVGTVRVSGSAEVGAHVTVNGIMADVAPDGAFAVDVALANGTNAIQVIARDAAGNTATVWVNGTFDDPDRRRIEQLEAENAALQAQLNATNASLQAAIAAGDAALLAEINDLNASLLTQLAAQNSALLGEIANLNATLLAQLAAGDAALAQLIADTNTSLLAELAALDGDLTQLIADTNSSLLAEMAAQDAALTASIAQTNATLFAALAAQNTALLDQLAAQNASLLAAMAAADGDLAQLIAETNATLLASLAAQDADLRQALADQNASLLAALALQNDDLLQAIATTNSSLLEALAAGDDALFDRLTADDAALWRQLNETAAAQQAALAGTQGGLDQTNSSLSGTQDELSSTTQSAASANMMALLGVALGAVGLALGGMAFMMARRRPPMGEPSGGSNPPPTPGGEEEVEVDVENPPGRTRGSSMAAEGELGGSYENDR